MACSTVHYRPPTSISYNILQVVVVTYRDWPTKLRVSWHVLLSKRILFHECHSKHERATSILLAHRQQHGGLPRRHSKERTKRRRCCEWITSWWWRIRYVRSFVIPKNYAEEKVKQDWKSIKRSKRREKSHLRWGFISWDSHDFTWNVRSGRIRRNSQLNSSESVSRQ